MEWVGSITDSALDTATWLAGLAIVFTGLVALMPCNRGMFWWKDLRAAVTDLLYWFVTPALVRIARVLLLAGGMALFFGDGLPGFAVIHGVPIWQQCMGVMLIQDVMLYWLHRVFH